MDSKQQIEVLQEYNIIAREELLIGLFMERGPKFLCNYLGLASINSKEWQVIFDYLVIEKNVLFALAKQYYEHFQNLYQNFGPKKIREILGIKVKKYDVIWLPIHNLIGVAEDCLLKYVYNNRFSLSKEMKVYGSEKVRENLQIDAKKYDQVWQQILDVLLDHEVETYMSAVGSERLIEVFTAQINLRREHIAL